VGDDIATTTGNSEQSGSSAESDITDLGHGVYQIDTRMAGYAGITAGYLIRSSRPCLVETGTSTSAPVVRAALATLGISADDLATVVVTHIHLDHAGGVGDIAAMFPSAEVVVHEKGARHLADPARLMASARMVYGGALDVLFGTLSPVPAGRLRTLGDTGAVDLGDGRRLDSYYSPGHAKHHVGLLDSLSGDLYVGDAAGVYVPETGDLRPATPPPDFDLSVALASIGKFASIGPSRLLFSHYGPVSDVSGTLERSAEEISVWVAETRAARSAGMNLDHAVEAVRQRTLSRYTADADPAVAEKFEQISGAEANVSGIWHWLDGLRARSQKPRSYRARKPRVARPMAKGAIVSGAQPADISRGDDPPVPPDVRRGAPHEKLTGSLPTCR
jgi:glyoxylase-like metal-dependent hydrolase (beta-lactamase superfamily II)